MTPTSQQVLIVEDSDTQALSLRTLLEDEGWLVVRSSNAESALRELSRSPPDLVIVDYHLPGMLGNELCRRIRENVGTRDIPILMLTADGALASEPGSFDSGVDDFVSKTAGPETLLLRVHALMRNSNEGNRFLLPRDQRFRRARVLAIDSNPASLSEVAAGLTSEGHEVWTAVNGEEALERLAREAFDAVVVNLVLNGADGIEICRRVRQGIRVRERPAIILIAAQDTKEEMARALEAGADDFVGRSRDLAALKARMRAQLRRKFAQEDNRKIGEALLRKELEAAEARAAKEIAETKALLAVELEQKNKELEAFSYSVSHDLRAPLRSIDGFSRALLESHSGQLDDRGRGYLMRVRAAAVRMGELIDDLLELSRVGRAELRRAPIDLSAMARHVTEELQQTEPARNARIVIADGVIAFADRRLILVLLENLLGNAWKFSAGVAETVIQFGTIEKEKVYFVSDNGAGFDMAYADRLFAPFQRFHSHAQFAGTGVGLATVFRIVDRHGGRIWAESAVNQGSSFFWTLPTGKQGGVS
jgi:two-component system NtrC family sensor kinase